MRRPVDSLPDVPLRRNGVLSARFRALGVGDLRACAEYLLRLPYGRTSSRSELERVLIESRGTCTTKHAVLAELAREQDVDLPLMLAIYEMTERNTPGVGRVLARHGLAAILEAHCYVRWNGETVDITRAVVPDEPLAVLDEERITAAQIDEYKLARHRRAIAECVASPRGPRGLTVDEVWAIREECITALARPESRRIALS